MNPPTISLPSAKGPSVTPAGVITFPVDLSLSPISTILDLNFAIHALNAANMSCICAGDACDGEGAPRYMQRNFLADMVCSGCLVGANRAAAPKTRGPGGIGHPSAPFRKYIHEKIGR